MMTLKMILTLMTNDIYVFSRLIYHLLFWSFFYKIWTVTLVMTLMMIAKLTSILIWSVYLSFFVTYFSFFSESPFLEECLTDFELESDLEESCFFLFSTFVSDFVERCSADLDLEADDEESCFFFFIPFFLRLP